MQSVAREEERIMQNIIGRLEILTEGKVPPQFLSKQKGKNGDDDKKGKGDANGDDDKGGDDKADKNGDGKPDGKKKFLFGKKKDESVSDRLGDLLGEAKDRHDLGIELISSGLSHKVLNPLRDASGAINVALSQAKKEASGAKTAGAGGTVEADVVLRLIVPAIESYAKTASKIAAQIRRALK